MHGEKVCFVVFFSLCLLRPVLSIYLFVKKPLNPNAHDTGAGWGGGGTSSSMDLYTRSLMKAKASHKTNTAKTASK